MEGGALDLYLLIEHHLMHEHPLPPRSPELPPALRRACAGLGSVAVLIHFPLYRPTECLALARNVGLRVAAIQPLSFYYGPVRLRIVPVLVQCLPLY